MESTAPTLQPVQAATGAVQPIQAASVPVQHPRSESSSNSGAERWLRNRASVRAGLVPS
jgi:hypothetical protein